MKHDVWAVDGQPRPRLFVRHVPDDPSIGGRTVFGEAKVEKSDVVVVVNRVIGQPLGQLLPDHAAALRAILQLLRVEGVAPEALTAAGHRVVHGGETLLAPCRITPQSLAAIEANIPLAPLHNPHNLAAIRALERIAQAKGALKHKDTAQKGEFIGKAISIIGGLEGCLDHSQEGELSQNLSNLYQYMIIALTEANVSDDIARLNEISDLLLTIKSAWEQIPEQARETGA